MNKNVILLAFIFLFLSCQQEEKLTRINYEEMTDLIRANNFTMPDDVTYYDLDGNLLNKEGKGKTNKINFFIKRKGKIPGTHSVIFQTPKETIELKHIAKSRDLFADGAINAAKWLANKKPGLYNMHDVLKIR